MFIYELKLSNEKAVYMKKRNIEFLRFTFSNGSKRKGKALYHIQEWGTQNWKKKIQDAFCSNMNCSCLYNKKGWTVCCS